MQVQDISLTQIVVVLLFLGTLILLQQLLKNNKFSFQDRLNKKKRVNLIEEFALSNSERIRLIGLMVQSTFILCKRILANNYSS
ncbi:MAG: hypothetical protein CM15mP98_09820 [Paracoccaceae bacterium]|nr:MAG: hypothetical protein CM15mP98_09820 [Paracoccaceae bacterium]